MNRPSKRSKKARAKDQSRHARSRQGVCNHDPSSQRQLDHGQSGHGRSDHGLSGDEQKLWSYVTRDASPLQTKAARRVGDRGGRPPVGHDDGEENNHWPARQVDQVHDRGAHGQHIQHDQPGQNGPAGRHVEPATSASAINTGPGYSPASGSANFDRRHAKKLARGAIEIEARIDLHGMRQREAHSALRRFLFNAHAKGYRMVLVITGKGNAQRNLDRDNDIGFDLFEQPGVLRRNVPQWINESDLRSIVVAHTQAHSRHGGEGALYIHLRRRKSFKPRN